MYVYIFMHYPDSKEKTLCVYLRKVQKKNPVLLTRSRTDYILRIALLCFRFEIHITPLKSDE